MAGESWGPIPVPVAAGIAGLAGGPIASGIQAKFAREDAREARRWQERMSNTAYRRATSDMRAAGLNPGLMYTSSGSAASTPNAQLPSYDIDSGIEAGVNSALAAKTRTLEWDAIRSGTSKNNADAAMSDALAERARADTDTAVATAEQVRRQTELLDQDLIKRKIDSEFYKTERGRKAREAQIWLETIFGSGSRGVGSVQPRAKPPLRRNKLEKHR